MQASSLGEKISRGPTVLFLGQSYLKIDSGKDSFLEEISNKFGLETHIPMSYSTILQKEWSDTDSAIAWMNERSNRLSTPNWLNTVARAPWNHVYTSAIDTLWYRSFRNELRETHPIFEEKYKPIDIRNRIQLHCTFLFGNVNRTEESEKPPLNRFEWLKRKQEAISLSRRINEIVTPLGIFIVEGYSPNQDWFSFDEFIPIINSLNIEQTHFFSVKEDDYENRDFVNLIDAQKIIPHTENLASFLIDCENNGSLSLNEIPNENFLEHSIQCEMSEVDLPLEIWKKTSSSAIILDDQLLYPPQKISPDKLYREFMEFLQSSGVIPVWSAYARNFSFERNFEKTLQNKTQSWLLKFDKHNSPIILHGQSGTGKTVALGKLAYNIRLQKLFPVVFIERKSTRPNYSDLDSFCKWVEDNGANCTLIIWDGMLDPEQYYDLLSYLLGRGRKVVLIGSCYKIADDQIVDNRIKSQKKKNFVEADSKMSKDEFSLFVDFLKKLIPDINLKNILYTEDAASFFVTLFRLLPATRSKLRAQLNQEVHEAQATILTNAELNGSGIPATTLGYALWEAKITEVINPLEEQAKELDGESLNRLEEIIGLIMVPGRFGINVPIELLLRALKAEWMNDLEENLNVDIFKWHIDNIGNILIGPRHALEAKLICQSRFGGSKTELKFIRLLLLSIRENNFSDSIEIQFAVDLVRSIGPNGQEPQLYSQYFQEISKILKELREERGIVNTRLMLQEATLLREYVSWCNKTALPLPNLMDILDQAESILQKALNILEKENRNDRQKTITLVELGTTLASKDRLLLENKEQSVAGLTTFNLAKSHLIKAISLDPEDFHPLDVLVWMSDNIIKSKYLDQLEENNLKADLQFFITTFDPGILAPDQLEHYYQKLDLVSNIINNSSLTEKAFNELEASGSKAGYYIRASKLMGELPTNEPITPQSRNQIKAALDYLLDNRDKLEKDGRCLSLLLKLWWFNKTGNPIIYKERQTVSFSEAEWLFIWKITTKLLEIGIPYSSTIVKYVNGLATFHLGQTENSLSIFRDLERDAENILGRRRILRNYLASTNDGRPQLFHGQVAWVNDRGDRAEVYVEELAKRIIFLPLDFKSSHSLKRGDSLGEFHIAFNFIGALAEPKNLFIAQHHEKR